MITINDAKALAEVKNELNSKLESDGYVTLFDVRVALGFHGDTELDRILYRDEKLFAWYV